MVKFLSFNNKLLVLLREEPKVAVSVACTIIWAICLFNCGCFENREKKYHAFCQKAKLCETKGDYAGAAAFLEKALGEKSDAKTLVALGKAYGNLGDLRGSERSYARALSLKPDAWEAMLGLVQVYLISGNLPDAEKTMEKLLAGDGKNPHVHVAYGDLQVLKNVPGAAEASYLRAFELSPDSSLASIRLACFYVSRKKTERAEIFFRQTVSNVNTSPRILTEIGNYWRLRGDLEKAEKFYREAAGADPDNIWLKNRLASFFWETNQLENAEKVLREILQKSSKNEAAAKLMVEIRLAQNDMGGASLILEEIEGSNPNDLEILFLKGKLHMLLGENSNASAFFEKILQLEPSVPMGHHLLGLSHLLSGDRTLSEREFVRTISLDSRFEDAEFVLGGIAYKNGEYDISRKYLERIAQKDPGHFGALLFLGNIDLAMGDYEKALTIFEAAEILDPKSPRPVYFKALAFELSNRWEDAISEYEKLLNNFPNLADASLRYARLLIDRGQSGKAVSFFEKSSGKWPCDGFMKHILGEVYLSLGQLEKALDQFLRATELEPELGSSWLRLFEIYEILDMDNEKRVELFEKCIARVPGFCEPYLKLSELRREMGDENGAISALEEGYRHCPKNPIIANNLAWFYLQTGKNAESAYKMASMAYEQFSDNPAVMDTMAMAYFRKGRHYRALKLLQEAVELEPESPMAHFDLGQVFHEAGNLKKAEQSIIRALELGLETSCQQQARSILYHAGCVVHSDSAGEGASNNGP